MLRSYCEGQEKTYGANPQPMTPGLEALRIVADLKCILLRLPVQTTESRGFKMKESEVFFVFFFFLQKM